jgi:DNA ligase (NAD+)
MCTNNACRAQIEQRISHWFRILGNADWFGIKTIRKLVDNGHDRLEAVYRLSEADFTTMGFGPVQSKNLAEAITTSRTKPVEDWRFLAAFGIADLGTGDSRKLLAHPNAATNNVHAYIYEAWRS